MIARRARGLPKRRRLWATAALALAWVSASSCADDGGGDQRSSLHGTVRDASTRKGVKGVSVTFLSDTLEQASDTSDGSGRFVIDAVSLVPRGKLTAEKAGYQTQVVSVFLDDEDVSIDLELERE